MKIKNELKNTRLQLHQATQLLASAGISFLDKQVDDSHTNMQWQSKWQSFSSSGFGPQGKFKVVLNLPDLKYQVLENDKKLSEFLLNNRTEQDAIEWFKGVLVTKGIDISNFTMKKHYEIPFTDQAQGKPYDLFKADLFKALTNHFNTANRVLTEIALDYKNSSAIRCWPHHFDLGMLITLRESPNPEEMKSIGLGLSPGDDIYDQPYYYISPWPYPDKSKLNNSNLPEDGFWHTEGFTSVILLADSYQKYLDIEKSIHNFLSTVIQINTDLILDY